MPWGAVDDYEWAETTAVVYTRYPGKFRSWWILPNVVAVLAMLALIALTAVAEYENTAGWAIFMTFVSRVLFAFIPPAFWLWFLFWRNRHLADYKGVLKFFAIGFWAVPPMALVQTALVTAILAIVSLCGVVVDRTPNRFQDFNNSPMYFTFALLAFGSAGIFEETTKFIVGLPSVKHIPNIHHPYTQALFLATGALGFSTLEHLCTLTEVIGVFFAPNRSVITFSLHVFCGFLLGSSWATIDTSNPAILPSFKQAIKVLWLPTLLHTLYDVCLLFIPLLPSMFFLSMVVWCVALYMFVLHYTALTSVTTPSTLVPLLQ
ncbi:hypothetical protein Pelo_13502 [Pelomyxa schiedti]|nr:hypothetical protein Pelo_13502 [Pelomyxa schiedti]